MSRQPSCLSNREVERLLLGHTPPDKAKPQLQHLKDCADCMKLVRSMQVSHTLSGTSPAHEPRAALPARPDRRPAASSSHDYGSTLRAMQRGDSGSSSRMGGINGDEPEEPCIGWVGHYRLVQLLGEGGMGIVYKAQDTQLQRRVAIKVMRPESAESAVARERFLREARAMAAVKHDNVVTIYQVGEEDGAPYLAMEYLRGDTLGNLFELGCKPPVTQVLRMARETASGLAAAHKLNLIHRDIKPGNLWLEAPSCRVKILDFGLARGVAVDAQLTRTGLIVGTPDYMAPEQARGIEVDSHCDLFSLGCVLYRLCAGRMPFQGNDAFAVLTSLAVDTPPHVRELNPQTPGPLADLVMRLLEKDPADRPASALEVVEALTAIERASSVRTPPPAPAKSAPAAPNQRPTTPPSRFPTHRIATPGGTYLIESHDLDVEIHVEATVLGIHDLKTEREYQIQMGTPTDDKLEVTDALSGLHFTAKQLVIKRGDRLAFRVWFEPRSKV